MGIRLALDYGHEPRWIEVPDGARVVRAPTPAAAAPPLDHLLATALDRPIAANPLEDVVRPGARAMIIVSDSTRAEPRAALVDAVLARIPGARVTIAIATGTHGPDRIEALQAELTGRTVENWVNHDGANRDALVSVGRTNRGTPVVVNRALLEADLVIATGCIIPHYFAGYGAGSKAIFPGLGGSTEIRINHLLKMEPGARAGVVEENPCRLDLEEAAAMLHAPAFLLNVVLDDDGVARAAVAGDLRAAFRAGAALCEPLYRVTSRPSRRIVVSARGPVTATLYQASKLVAAAAPLLLAGGTIIVAAECSQGTGPLDTVNRAIHDIGLKPRLPADHRIVLVSSLSEDVVSRTYCTWSPSVEQALNQAGDDPPIILPRASKLLCTAAT